MQQLRTINDLEAPGEGFSPRSRGRRLTCALIPLIGAGLWLVGGASGAAHADPAGVSLVSPVVDQFVSGSTVTVSGTSSAEGSVAVNASTGGSCIAEVTDSNWSCPVAVSSGAVTLTATSVALLPNATSSPAPDSAHGTAGDSATVVFHVLTEPIIDGSTPIVTQGAFIGRGFPHAGITLRLAPSGGGPGVDFPCPPVATDGRWTCVTTPSVGDYRLTVTQFVPSTPHQQSPPSAPAAVVIDRTPPPSPTVVSPRPGDLLDPTTAISGTGVEGGRVDVYVDDLRNCSATVTNGAWSCISIALGSGAHVIQALQFDPAGNFSELTLPIAVSVADPAPVVSPSPSAASPAPPAATQSEPDTPGHTRGPTAAPPVDTHLDADSGWGALPRLGKSVPTMSSALDGDSGLAAILLAVAFVALVAIPLRAVATAAPTYLRRPHVRVFGRNRRVMDSPAPSRRERAMGVVLCLVAVSSVSAAPGWDGGTADLRLTVALMLAVTLLNAIAPAIASWRFRRPLAEIRIRVLPELLLAAVVASILSESLGLHPPVLVGVFLVASVAEASGTSRKRLAVGSAQVLGLVAMSMAAWLAHTALLGSGGGWDAALSELSAGVCVGGLTSSVVLLLPAGRLPGRDIFRGSRILWGTIALTTSVLGGAVLSDGFDARMLWVIAGFIGVAAVCSATLIWVRWVEPALGR
jgi:hypothetical protein